MSLLLREPKKALLQGVEFHKQGRYDAGDVNGSEERLVVNKWYLNLIFVQNITNSSTRMFGGWFWGSATVEGNNLLE